MIFISPTEVTVQGGVIVQVAEILKTRTQNIKAIGERLQRLGENVIGLKTKTVAETQEVTLLVDKSVPFSVVKKVMSTCTSRGYGRISLAVLQRAPDSTGS